MEQEEKRLSKPKTIKLRDFIEVIPREDHPKVLKKLYGEKLIVENVICCNDSGDWLYEVTRIPGLVSERTIKKYEPRKRSKYAY